MMESKFKNRRCSECGSDNLAHIAEWYSGEIPIGVEGEIACRGCFYWEKLLTIEAASDILDTPHWVVLEAGRGQYTNPEEQAQTVIYRNPDADTYPRFGVG